jgi:ubiquinone/menaquinone biosynthesis C-methylase UbiE
MALKKGMDMKGENRVKKYYNAVAADYEKKFSSGFLGRHREGARRKLMQLLEPKKGEKILDAGCGVGFEAACLKGMGCDVLGVDISEEMLAQARRHGIKTKVADLGKMKLGRQFDKILCVGVLEFCSNHEQILRNLRRHLKPGGRLVLLVPRRNPLGGIYRLYHRKNKINITLFSKAKIEKLLRKAGFSTLRSENTGYFNLAVLAVYKG